MMPLILPPDQSDNLSTPLLLTLIEYMQVWLRPNFALLASCLGKPDGPVPDQQLFGIDKRCQSETMIIEELGKVFKAVNQFHWIIGYFLLQNLFCCAIN